MATSELPLTRKQAVRVAEWMTANFDSKLAAAIQGTVFKKKHLCAIVCQETASVWLKWLDRLSTSEILARCVFDASGDAPDAPRSAFPKNTAAFRERYGDEFTRMLIDEANQTRALRDFGPKEWVYKGYGLFQYDLQHVTADETFFRERQWRDFDTCLSKAMAELKRKFAATNDLWAAIKAYNGSGPRAEQYMKNVQQFTEFCGAVTKD
jgi:hypothetical protein